MDKEQETVSEQEQEQKPLEVQETEDVRDVSEEEIPCEEDASCEDAERFDDFEQEGLTEESEPPESPAAVTDRGAVLSLRLSWWHLALIVFVAAAMVAGGIALGMQLAPRTGIDKDAIHYPWSPSGGSADAQSITIPGYDRVTLPANVQDVDLVLPNPTDNPCNFWYTLILEDTGEVLYRSGMIPPGMAVTEITLARALSVGNYSMTVLIETASVSDGVPMNGATISVDLEVR